LAVGASTWLCDEATSLGPAQPGGESKAECVTRSNKLLRQLHSIEHHDWPFVITRNESWFYLSKEHERTGANKGLGPLSSPRKPLTMLIYICRTMNDDYVSETLIVNFLKYNCRIR
jgi:hypothetical protein